MTADQPAPSLLPCPFCGKPPRVITGVMGEWRSRKEGYEPSGERLGCSDLSCGVITKACFGDGMREKAIAAWNRRTPSPAVVGTLRQKAGRLMDLAVRIEQASSEEEEHRLCDERDRILADFRAVDRQFPPKENDHG